MNNKEFGLKIRQLRQEKNLTREEFCGDETELSVRQLSRIESGESKPTLAKITYIANRFGKSLYEVMPDYVSLPEKYLKLKYDVLRTPTYEEEKKIDWRDEILTEIYDTYYEELPEEEQITVDTIRSMFDVHDTREATYGKEILEEYFFQISHKDRFSVNELLMSKLFIEHYIFTDTKDSYQSIFNHLLDTLPSQIDFMEQKDLFILRDVLFAVISAAGREENYAVLPAIIDTIEQIMVRTQDYQKLPILRMINWKYALVVEGDAEKGAKFFEEAKLAARMIGDQHLQKKIDIEWESDLKENM